MKIALTVLALALVLPTIGSSEEIGRYQAVHLNAGVMLIIDTRTGKVIKRCYVKKCVNVNF